VTFEEFLEKLETDYALDEELAHLLFDEVAEFVLRSAAGAFPTMTHDMASRGAVVRWLEELAAGRTEYLP
jgi:hypothetical protein